MEESVRENLREKLTALIGRINTNKTHESDFLPIGSVTFDCDPYWIDVNLPSKSWDLRRAWGRIRRIRAGGLSAPSLTPHDSDYYLFKYLNATMGVILDVGANYGSSVASIQAVGSCCPIISFEALPVCEECLARAKELDEHGHDFIMSGVSEAKKTDVFFVPTVNGRTISGLATASVSSMNEYTIKNILDYVEIHAAKADFYRVNFIKIPIISDTIDYLIRTRNISLMFPPARLLA